MGLTACRKKLPPESPVAGDVDRLLDLTREGIADLRGYVHGLREGSARMENLLAALRGYAARFSEATGIGVRVASLTELRVNERLATDVFQLVAEGLSNIRRHTDAREAAIELWQDVDHLIIRIENPNQNGQAPSAFHPRSISERAASLGGRAVVEQHEEATRVIVDIPL
jgi:signal transduction histidine kinase